MAHEKPQNQRGTLFVVSGPSGSGKSTLCRAVIEQTDVQLSISATTRPRSPSETDGRDYYFMDEDQFIKKVDSGGFLEHACVFGHYYGTPAEPVARLLDSGRTVLLEIDVQGALQVFEKLPEAQGVFVMPPSDAELSRRLSSRGRDDQQTIDKRLAKAHWEIDQARASGRYGYTVVNDDLHYAIEQIKAIITQQEQPQSPQSSPQPQTGSCTQGEIFS